MKNFKVEEKKIWTQHFGNRVIARDFAGRRIKLSRYNSVRSEDNAEEDLTWTIDHILPISKGGTDARENLIPVHHLTNLEKANNFPIFTANGKAFEAVEAKVKGIKSSENKEYNTYNIKEVTKEI